MVLAMSRWRQRAWMRVLALFWHATMLAASWEGLITGVAFLDAGMMSSAVGPVAHRAKVATKQRSTNTHTSTKIRQIAGMDLGARGHRLLTTRTQSGSSRRRVNTGSGHNGARTRGSGARHCRRPATRGLSPLAVRLPRLDDAAPRQGVEPPRAPTGRAIGPARTRKRSISCRRHCRPSAAAGARPRSVARFGWAQPNRAGNARTRGDGPGAQWALPCFRDTATHGRQRAGPCSLIALSRSLPSSPPSPCRVLWDWWGPATQITRSLETRTESPRLPLSLQQCHSASHRFPLA
jgi:hypothetical protein